MPLTPRHPSAAAQLRLDLAQPQGYRRDDFVTSPANAEAVRAVEAWPNWIGHILCLVGPEGTGKSHLAALWAARAGAADATSDLAQVRNRPVLVENADTLDEELLFHLINMAGEPGGGLLLTARRAPSLWSVNLPDLRSRLNALTVAELGPPDDDILIGVMRKFFRERNIRPEEDVFAYLVRRIERSVPHARLVVAQLDEAGAARQREVNRALAREVLDAAPQSLDMFDEHLAERGSPGEKGL